MIIKILQFTVTDEYANKYLKDILTKKYKFSDRIIRNMKNSSGTIINGQVSSINYILKLDDIVEILIDEDTSENIVPVKMSINIIYEDESLIAVDKPPGLVVHPTSYYYDDTLANGIMYYYNLKGIKSRFRAINRLDRNTSGIVLIAKSQLAHSILSNQIVGNNFKKEYFAVVHNKLKSLSGTIDYPIARKPNSIIERIVDENGQSAITQFCVIEQNEISSLVRINLITGRTHQIRVHFSYINHPLFGDDLYGANDDFKRQALHCSKLEFNHPFTNEKITINSSIPEDISSLLVRLKLDNNS